MAYYHSMRASLAWAKATLIQTKPPDEIPRELQPIALIGDLPSDFQKWEHQLDEQVVLMLAGECEIWLRERFKNECTRVITFIKRQKKRRGINQPDTQETFGDVIALFKYRHWLAHGRPLAQRPSLTFLPEDVRRLIDKLAGVLVP